MKLRWIPLVVSLCLLTGCASLLERTYSTSEPHSSKFWESEAAGTLRAENYQDVVNDLLLLISQHTETATLRLYNFSDDMTVADTLERATTEILQETPMGAYAVEYITSSSQAQRGYYEIAIQLKYRRTAEQVQAVLNATSPEAIYSLLETALNEGKTELAVRVGYWGSNGRQQVEDAMARLREDRKLTEDTPWLAYYYPENGPVGLLEFLLDPPQELVDEELAKQEAEEIPEPIEETAEPAEGEAAIPAEPEEAVLDPEKENQKN